MAHDKGSRPFVLGEVVRCVVEEELKIEELFFALGVDGYLTASG